MLKPIISILMGILFQRLNLELLLIPLRSRTPGAAVKSSLEEFYPVGSYSTRIFSDRPVQSGISQSNDHATGLTPGFRFLAGQKFCHRHNIHTGYGAFPASVR
jgi:hypothetical protein